MVDRRRTAIVVALVLCSSFVIPPAVTAGPVGKLTLRGTTLGTRGTAYTYRRPVGPSIPFRKPTPLERFTNRPGTDARRGLGEHSFWRRPGPGRKGGPAHIERRLNIPHQVIRREVMLARPGMKYHERPIKGGLLRSREVIIHQRVPAKEIKLRETLRRG